MSAPSITRSGCGTANGRQAHHRRGEQPCDPCRRAHREYERARRARAGGPRTRQRLVARVHDAERSALTATVVAGAAMRLTMLHRVAVEHRLRQLASSLDANARSIESPDAAVALRFAARELRRELVTLNGVTA